MRREQFIKEYGWSQNPNTKAVENSLGSNAENWYGKDAKIANLIFGSIKYGASFGFILYKAAASIYGVGSFTAQAAGGAEFNTGSNLGFEGQSGLGESNPKRYLKINIKGLFK